MPSFRGSIKAAIAIGAFSIVAFGGGAFFGAPPWGGAGDDGGGMSAAQSATSVQSVASAAMVDAVDYDDDALPPPKAGAEDLDPAILGGKAARTFANLDSSLDAVAKAAGAGIGADAVREALENAPLRDGDAIAVSVRAARDISGAKDFLASNGVSIDYSGRTWLEAYVPADLLGALSGQADVVSVAPIVPAVTTQTTPSCDPIALGTLGGNVSRSESYLTICPSQARAGAYARFYTFTTSARAALEINLRSSDADAYLYLRQGDGTLTGTALHEDDDGGDGLNARIYEILPAGDYTLEATTAGSGDDGSFTLSLGYDAVNISGADCVTDLGTLDSDNLAAESQTWTTACDSARVAGRHAKFYTFTVASNQHRFMQAWLTSADGRLFLTKGNAGDGSEWVAGFDTPSDNKIPSDGKIANKVEWFLGAGTYTIEAANDNPGTAGAFDLTVDPDAVGTVTTSGGNCDGQFGVNTSIARGTHLVRFRWNSCNNANDNEFLSMRPASRSLVTIDYFPYNFNTTTELTFRNSSAITYTGGATVPASITGRITHSMVLNSPSMLSRRFHIYPVAVPRTNSGDWGMRITVSAVPAGTASSGNVPPPTPTPDPDVCTDTTPSTGTARTISLDLTSNTSASDNWTLDSACGSRNRPGSYGRLYELTLAVDANVYVSVDSSAVNPYVYLMEGSIAAAGDVLTQDDDGGAGIQSTTEAVALDAGTYTIEVTSNGAAETGAYAFVANASAIPAAPTAEPVNAMNTCAVADLSEIRGSLTRSGTWDENCEAAEVSHVVAETGLRLHADYYAFNLPVRSLVSIEANAGGAMPRLYLRSGASATTGEKVAEDSDPALARVRRMLDAGYYTVEIAQPDDADLANDYDLTIASANLANTGCSVDLGTLGPLDGGWARSALAACSSSRYEFALSEGARASVSAISGAATNLRLTADSGNENRIEDYAKSVSANSPDWSRTIYLPKGDYTLTASGRGVVTVGVTLSAPFAGGAAEIHNVPQWRALGYTGDGVKVAVIDEGFAGYKPLIGVEVPAPAGERCGSGAPDDCLSAAASGSSHGASAAEAIHDIAPDADIYLTQATTPGQLLASVNWMLSEDVDVASMSLSFPWDSSPNGALAVENSVARSISKATRGGVVWVNSGGNEALSSWRGGYADGDSDNLIEFATGDETNAVTVETAGVYTFEMRWDDAWGGAARDLDLYLVDTLNNVIASSEDYQSGDDGDIPHETIIARLEPGTYRLVARQDSGTDPDWVQLRNFGGALNLENPALTRTSSSPADLGDPALVAAGASAYYSSDPAPYSGYGTADGRAKPDVVGAESDISAAAGETPFAGASQAAPHTAGLAALMKQRHPDADPLRIARYLRHSADYAPGAAWGYGLARLRDANLALTGGALNPEGGLGDGARAGWAVSTNSDSSFVAYTVLGESIVHINDSGGWTGGTRTLPGPSGTVLSDEYGYSIDMSSDGRTIAVGAPGYQTVSGEAGYENGKGRVYVFYRTGSSWPSSPPAAANLVQAATDQENGDRFGTSVSVSADGSHIAVGAPGDESGDGAAYIFTRSGNAAWATTSSSVKVTRGTDATNADAFGTSVSISEDDGELVVGAPGAEAAYAFVYNTTSSAWPTTPTATLTNDGGSAGDRFGISVSISASGDEIAVGAPSNIHTGPGEAHVYVKGTAWTDRTEPTTSLFPAGGVYGGEFGHAVAMSGNGQSVSVGAPRMFGGGALYKFARGTSWDKDPESRSSIESDSGSARLGWSIDNENNGGAVAYGMPGAEGGAGRAARKDGGSGRVILSSSSVRNGFEKADNYGSSVAISEDGRIAVVGAGSAENAASGFRVGSGAAYAFTGPSTDSGNATTTAAKLSLGSAHNGAQREGFGETVAVSGDGGVIAVSARRQRSGVYVFTKPSGGWGDNPINSGYAVLSPTTNDPRGFGQSIVISRDGGVIVVAAPEEGGAPTNFGNSGAAYVFTRPNNGWGTSALNQTHAAQLKPASASSADIEASAAYRGSGLAISADGSTIAMGAPGARIPGSPSGAGPGYVGSVNTGEVYLYARPQTGWGTSAITSGHARIRVFEGASWSNDDIDRFGQSVALSEDGGWLFAGIPADNGWRGGVYVFERPATGWGSAAIGVTSASSYSYARKIVPTDVAPSDNFGSRISVSADGSRLAVSSPNRRSAGHHKDAGAVYIIDEPSGGWGSDSPAPMTSSGPAALNAANARMGERLALSGDGTAALAGASSYGQGRGYAQLFGFNDPPAPPSVSVSPNASVVSYSAGRFMRFPVTLSAASAQRVTVEYETDAAGSGYEAARGTVSFAPGETSKTASVRLTTAQTGDTVMITLSSPVNAELGDAAASGAVRPARAIFPVIPPRTPTPGGGTPGTGGGSNGGSGGTGGVDTASASIRTAVNSLSFAVDLDGDERASKTLEVWNARSASMRFSVSENASWLSVSPVSAVSTGTNDRERISVTADGGGLSEGRYTATITISASGAANKTVSVLMDVSRSESAREPVAPPVAAPPVVIEPPAPGTTPAPAPMPAQRIATPDGTIQLIIPAGATDQPVEIEAQNRAPDAFGAPPAADAGERAVNAVSVNTYARGGETPLEITYNAWLSLRFTMPTGLGDACDDGRARVYRVSGATWTPVPHRCETDEATGETYAVVLLNRFSDYVMTVSPTAPATPTPAPTATPVPPTATPEPTATPAPDPTPAPPTATPFIPTPTSVPQPTATPPPFIPTATPAPVAPTATPVIVAQAPPTATPQPPAPTATSVPPTATPAPQPTVVLAQPTATPATPPPAPAPEADGGGISGILIAIIAIIVLAAAGGGGYYALRQRGMI